MLDVQGKDFSNRSFKGIFHTKCQLPNTEQRFGPHKALLFTSAGLHLPAHSNGYNSIIEQINEIAHSN